jgi:hypothetical protein
MNRSGLLLFMAIVGLAVGAYICLDSWENIHLKGSIGVADQAVYAFTENQMLTAVTMEDRRPDALGRLDDRLVKMAIAQTMTPGMSGEVNLSVPRKKIPPDGNLVIVTPGQLKDGFQLNYRLVHIPEATWLRELSCLDRQDNSLHLQTARIVGPVDSYEIRFPAAKPEGFEGGNISSSTYYDNNARQGRTQIVDWDIYPGAGHPNSFSAGSIELMVTSHALPGVVPAPWQIPFGWGLVTPSQEVAWLTRTSAGIHEVAGLKFAVTRWTAKYFKTRLSGSDYLAQDGDKIIGLRGYNCGDERATARITESVLSSLRKVKTDENTHGQAQPKVLSF